MPLIKIIETICAALGEGGALPMPALPRSVTPCSLICSSSSFSPSCLCLVVSIYLSTYFLPVFMRMRSYARS